MHHMMHCNYVHWTRAIHINNSFVGTGLLSCRVESGFKTEKSWMSFSQTFYTIIAHIVAAIIFCFAFYLLIT